MNWTPLAKTALIACSVSAMGLAAPVTTTDPQGNMVLGNPSAKVTVAEYASVGCPHCAEWARTVYPAFRAKYVATGKVRFVMHEMLTGDGALAAAGFLLARCAGPANYFQVVDQVYARQSEIEEKGATALSEVGKAAGLTDAQFAACLSDDAALKALGERVERDAREHHVDGTPTFFVDGARLDGEQTLAGLEAAIAHAKR